MFHENEVITFCIGFGALIFIMMNRPQLRNLPRHRLLYLGFYFLLAGWILTILEGFFWEGTLNLLEHTTYFLNALCWAEWCRQVYGRGEGP